MKKQFFLWALLLCCTFPTFALTFEVKGVSFKMIAVEGGTFTMGATSEQGTDVYDTEKPAHSVTLSDYYIGETEVTQALWKAVMGETPIADERKQWSSTYGLGDNYPAYNISWDDCQEFIEKLNALTDRKFCLPTEAEWEYAARGGNKSKGYKYSGSDTINNVACYVDNGNTLDTVGARQANELGIYDMSGNIVEWCFDRYGSYKGSQINPTGPTSGSNHRIMRGGSYQHTARQCRVSHRTLGDPQSRHTGYGLRLVLYPKYTITGIAEEGGIVTGSGEYSRGNTASLTAVPNTGYAFDKWTDGMTTNPRILTVTQDRTFTATFVLKKHTVTFKIRGGVVTNANAVAGDVFYSSAKYDYGTVLNVVAKPAPNYKFVAWEDDASISAERTIIVTKDATYTAICEPMKYTITTTVNNAEWGSVTEGGEYIVGTAITLTAKANEDYQFSAWNDGNTDNPRTIRIASDSTFTAIFKAKQYALIYTIDGVETSRESIAYGTPLTAKAEPSKEGHTFSGWSEVPATMPAKDVTVTGTFTVNSYNLIYTVDGVETIRESIAYGTPLTAKAEPSKEGHTFSGWSEVPATMPAKDITITGTFTVNSYNLIYTVDGVETSRESIAYGTPLTAKAEPSKEGHTFSGWSEVPATMPAKDVTVSGTFAAIHISEITLNEHSLDLSINTTYSLIVTITPADALNQSVSWSSDNEAVATVADGVVTALSNGTATITATATDGGITATCEVTVTTPVSGVQFAVEGTLLNMKVGESTYLEAIVLPETASNKNVTYTSSNESCVFVDNGELTQGYLIAETAGVSTVTVTTEDGGLTASIAVIVSNDTSTNLEDVSLNDAASLRKVFKNGTIYILRNGEKYTIDGRRVM